MPYQEIGSHIEKRSIHSWNYVAKGGGSIIGFVISNGRGVESLSYYSKVSCGMTLAKSEYLVLNAYSNFHLW